MIASSFQASQSELSTSQIPSAAVVSPQSSSKNGAQTMSHQPSCTVSQATHDMAPSHHTCSSEHEMGQGVPQTSNRTGLMNGCLAACLNSGQWPCPPISLFEHPGLIQMDREEGLPAMQGQLLAAWPCCHIRHPIFFCSPGVPAL